MVATLRYGTALTLGGAITAGLLLTMQLMIAAGEAVMVEPPAFRSLAMFPEIQPKPPETDRKLPQPPPPVDARPPEPTPPVNLVSESMGVLTVPPPILDVVRETRGPAALGTDGPPLPLVKVTPVYPQSALARDLEGHVVVEFTVTRLGTVTDVRVVESSNRVFERAAVAAAEKFRYQPRIIDGEPVTSIGVRNIISFTLEK